MEQEIKYQAKNKFNAKKIIYNGIKFDSTKEANFYKKLLLLKNASLKSERVEGISMQVRYDMIINGINCGFYKLDFLVEYANGDKKYIDVKGYKKGAAYQIFRLKKKIIEALHNIQITEI